MKNKSPGVHGVRDPVLHIEESIRDYFSVLEAWLLGTLTVELVLVMTYQRDM